MRLESGSRAPWPSGRTCPNDAFPSPYPLWLGGSVRGSLRCSNGGSWLGFGEKNGRFWRWWLGFWMGFEERE